ncbi:MAG: HGGxSTG domain-containing protein [Proteobacteria bacterium]|nr:HGGxSTG domain-containing protein [Pseudomonadota bacterium]
MIETNDTEPNDTKLCLAKTRSGAPCQKHPIAGRTRCRLHGGLSTGPKTPEGKAACVAAHWKHGRRSKAYVEARKQIWSELRRVEREMRGSRMI